MSLFHMIIVGCVVCALAATALCTIVRIVRGPTLLDRMIASDVLLTTVVLTVGADMALRGHTDSIVLMTAITASAVFATIVVARYVQRRNTVENDHTSGTNVQGEGVVRENGDSYFPPTASTPLQHIQVAEEGDTNDR